VKGVLCAVYCTDTDAKDEQSTDNGTEHGVMEENRADDDLEQRKAPHASRNAHKFSSNAKTRMKTCVGIEVS
jgi:hypothetical protein